MADEYRKLPSVDRFLHLENVEVLSRRHARGLVVEAARQVLEQARDRVSHGEPAPAESALVRELENRIAAEVALSPRPVINATGVVIHTNLGRAPLSSRAMEAMRAVALGYSDLEYDIQKGTRGSRHGHPARLLTRLSGATGALVVNNNASAVLLVLTALAKGKEVIISRGQLVEIGGGFRVPEVMRQSGARLVEVGTTNRTYIQDYAEAITPRTALLLKVHTSNFQVTGFVHSTSTEELVALGKERGLPVVEDLGSGALQDTAPFGLGHEPMVQESIAAGASLACFSGDKLLGGPQAGIIVGDSALVAKLARHPLMRALRPDKLTLAALSATLVAYLEEKATGELPVWRMIAAPLEDLECRCRRLAGRLLEVGQDAIPWEGRSTVGGGSLPGETLPTWLVAIRHKKGSPQNLAAKLRQTHPPIIARIERDHVVLDLRTVLPEQDDQLASALTADPWPLVPGP